MDDDVLDEIRMNPYLQYFIGLPEFIHEVQFDQSVITRFRKRVTPAMLSEINDILTERKKMGKGEKPNEPPDEQPPIDETGRPDGTVGTDVDHESGNSGTLILDVTCAPQAIRFPTDISLMSEAREKVEEMINAAHEAGFTNGKKPRSYRQLARRDYLRFARNRMCVLSPGERQPHQWSSARRSRSAMWMGM